MSALSSGHSPSLLRPLLLAASAVAGSAHAGVAVPHDSPAAIALGRTFDLYWIAEALLALLIPAGFLVSGFGARLSAACCRLAHGARYASVTLFGCAYLLLDALLRLPLDYLRHFVLPTSLGWLKQESAGGWLLGQGVSLLGLMIAVVLLLWMPYWLIRRSPRRWWLWSTAVSVPVACVLLVSQPLWMKPLAATYGPVADKSLQAQITMLAAQCGHRHVPVVVGGSDTTVVGLGPSSRIVLQRDLAEVESPSQVRFTIAHELKHYVMGDNWKALLIAALLLLAGFGSMHGVGGWAIGRWPRRLGFARLDDPASLPLFVLCATGLWLAVTPAFLAFDRHIEREADRFALEMTHENDAAARMFAGWASETELAEPGWFERLFRATHPPVGERIRMANRYRPWATGEPLEYAGECAMPAGG
ncbi:M48 family metalloprotease [Frateuria defendens]|uniref:M48 family metalloprotease n=1 Tax=Frateuria defendens TaxID=2219559 RepID=UPI00066FFE23|nr:M48 family metalloprotease [Frateuria defendens]